MPRLDRGIQGSAAVIGSRNLRRGVLDRPDKPGDDTFSVATPAGARAHINYQTRSRCAASCRPSCWQSPR
ncbi:hypothetical protein CVM73_12575 [Bradyrhizobium forestalis]|uniref:Uncharacterized protein n=1 Tax=Bradyrhizobium forestalis TaxID=1419263 RepID=A0A2M8RAS4_9BRAD|nr:hypothetical protein CVM73_12575 [Bradyrhizobium forestalis]